MQIVIDIDDNLYTRLFDNGVDNYDDAVDMAKAIRKGTPLPKGHGKIVDIDKLIDDKCNECGHLKGVSCTIPCYAVRRMLSAPTIVEADEVESE